MAHRVKCYYCGLTFDRDRVKDWVQVKSNRYAHRVCDAKAEKDKDQEQKDLEDLENYIMKLFNADYVNARIRKQINDFKSQHNYTYTGMRKSLVYFYEIKKNSLEKANGGIGIIPYIYDSANQYYYNIWLANQTNEAKPIIQYQPVEREIIIPPPKRVEKKKKLFSFLDEEV